MFFCDIALSSAFCTSSHDENQFLLDNEDTAHVTDHQRHSYILEFA